MGYQGLNLVWPHAKEVPYPLYYLFSSYATIVFPKQYTIYHLFFTPCLMNCMMCLIFWELHISILQLMFKRLQNNLEGYPTLFPAPPLVWEISAGFHNFTCFYWFLPLPEKCKSKTGPDCPDHSSHSPFPPGGNKFQRHWHLQINHFCTSLLL